MENIPPDEQQVLSGNPEQEPEPAYLKALVEDAFGTEGTDALCV